MPHSGLDTGGKGKAFGRQISLNLWTELGVKEREPTSDY
jgi:hypothetical protein